MDFWSWKSRRNLWGGRGEAGPRRRTSGGGKGGGKMSGIFSSNFPPAASSLAGLKRICLTGGRLNSRCWNGRIYIFLSHIFPLLLHFSSHLQSSLQGRRGGALPVSSPLLSQLLSVRLNTRQGVFALVHFCCVPLCFCSLSCSVIRWTFPCFIILTASVLFHVHYQVLLLGQGRCVARRDCRGKVKRTCGNKRTDTKKKCDTVIHFT